MKAILEGANAALTWLLPEREEFETGQFYGWRNRVAWTVFGLGGVFGMFAAWALGLVTVFGTTGFAMAGQAITTQQSQQTEQRIMQAVNQAGNDIMARVIAGQIFDVRMRQCAARRDGRDGEVAALDLQMQSLLDAYAGHSGRPYALRACP